MSFKIKLKCLEGIDKGKKWHHNFGKAKALVIGRIPGCHIILRDYKVSQSHCMLYVQADQIYLLDMGSTYGTCVNDNSIEGPYKLQHEDIINLGKSRLEFKVTNKTYKIGKANFSKDKLSNETDEEKQEKKINSHDKEAVTQIKKFETNNKNISAESSQDSTKEHLYTTNETEDTKFRTSVIKCKFCNKIIEKDSLKIKDWHYCFDCKYIAEFLLLQLNKKVAALKAPNISENWHVNKYGCFITFFDKADKKILFISKYDNHQIITPKKILDEKGIKNPYIYPVIDSQIYKDRFFATLPYYPGKFLDINELYSPQKAISIVIEVAKALEYNHKNLGPYGYITPEDIYIEVTGEIFLIGYGLPRSYFFIQNRELQDLKSLYFTPPEMIIRQLYINKACEIFSLSSLLFYLLTNSYIYKGKNVHDIQKQAIAFVPSTQLISLPMAKSFFKTALNKDPKQRYNNISQFIDILSMLYSAYNQ